MLEVIITKIKEYKILVCLSLIGLIIAGFFLMTSKSARQSNVGDIAQEATNAKLERKETSTETKKKQQKEETESQKNLASEELEFLTVDVKGAVKNPGIYQLKKQAESMMLSKKRVD